MARGRLISKSLGSSRKYHALLNHGAALGEFCQVLFPLIIANTDDFGRMSGDAFTVKNVAFPASPRAESEFDSALDIMHRVGLLTRYTFDGETYIEVRDFDAHQVNLHKRTLSRYPPAPSRTLPEIPGNSGEVPDDSRKFRETPSEFKRTESNGTEGNAHGRVSRFSGSVLSGSLHRDHLDHAKCSPNFAWCVPNSVHAKLAPRLAPRHGGDVAKAKDELLAWYSAVWASLPDGTVLGDAFKFWGPRFDAAFASGVAVSQPSKPYICSHVPPCVDDVAHTQRKMREKREVGA